MLIYYPKAIKDRWVSEDELHKIWYNATRDDITISLAKGLKAISRALKGRLGV